MRKLFTLIYLFDRDGRLLLGMKKRGFGAGRWNGFGGKVKEGESIEEAARRELKEEADIEAGGLSEVGYLEFEFEKERGTALEVHVFRADSFAGTPQESDEMRPEWFPVADIPYGSMWESDRHWFPLFLTGKKFRGAFLFAEGDAVAKAHVEEVDAL